MKSFIKDVKEHLFDVIMLSTLLLLMIVGFIVIDETAQYEETQTTKYIIRYAQDDASIETSEKETVMAAEETTTQAVKYYEVALDTTVQNYIFAVCEDAHINPALIIAIIERESNYKSNAVGDNGNSLGLMQINTKWQASRIDKLGVADLFSPIENVRVGIDIIDELTHSSEDLCWILQAYNGGVEYANNNFKVGRYDTDYTSYVIERMQELDAERSK